MAAFSRDVWIPLESNVGNISTEFQTKTSELLIFKVQKMRLDISKDLPLYGLFIYLPITLQCLETVHDSDTCRQQM
jgi:hypothetical protein